VSFVKVLDFTLLCQVDLNPIQTDIFLCIINFLLFFLLYVDKKMI